MAVDVSNEVYDSIKRYFDSLALLGYKSNRDVARMLIYSFIEEILTGDLSIFVTEEDYKIISKAVECITGDCLIPYKYYIGSELLGKAPSDALVRLTENTIERVANTQESDFRQPM